MERAVASLKWKTTASAACIPRRDSTSPYSMAATVLPTASRIVCSLCSGLGGPIILGCSPLLACWLSMGAPSASCGRPLPSDTAHLTLMCLGEGRSRYATDLDASGVGTGYWFWHPGLARSARLPVLACRRMGVASLLGRCASLHRAGTLIYSLDLRYRVYQFRLADCHLYRHRLRSGWEQQAAIP